MDPLENLSDEVKEKIETLKEKGNPVFMTEISGTKYVYQGLLGEDWITIRAATSKLARQMAEGSDKLSEGELEVLSTRIEEVESNVILEYAIIDPPFSTEAGLKMPAARTRRLRELVFAASGDNEEVSEPVKL